jgi:hypothetical protein
MAHSFVAYIDEAGDEGFKFKVWPERASSEWFVLAACIVREKLQSTAMREIKRIVDPIEKNRNAPLHFKQLPHEARVAVCHGLGKTAFRIVVVSVNKRALPQPHTLRGNRRLYFYYTRYFVERLSWLTRDHRIDGEGDGFCKLVFSRAKNLSYVLLKEYLTRLKNHHQTQIDWSAIDPDGIEVLQHDQSLGLRLADAAASGVHCALELSPHGFCEDRYVRLLKPTIYRNGNNYRSYGMKIVPQAPEPEVARDGRYGWIEQLFGAE